MQRKTGYILLSLILTAMAVFTFDCKENQDSGTSLVETNPEGLYIAAQNGLFDLRYDSANQQIEKLNEVALADLADMVVCGQSVYVSTTEILRTFDQTFKPKNTKKFEGVGDVATDGKMVYVAAEGSFIALDKDLKELGRVKLEFEGPVPPNKNAHDIQIHNNTAYLLDNIMGPLFLFRVDVKKPERMHITERIAFQDINAHLHGQWLNPDLDQWLVIQSFAHRGGAGKNVHIYPLDTGKEAMAVTQVYSYHVIPERKEEGYDLKGVTALPPVWAVVKDVDMKFYVVRVSSEHNQISFSEFVHLDISGRHQDIIIRRKGSYLFIVPKFESSLFVIALGDQPRVVISRDLQELNIRAVVDLQPY